MFHSIIFQTRKRVFLSWGCVQGDPACFWKAVILKLCLKDSAHSIFYAIPFRSHSAPRSDYWIKSQRKLRPIPYCEVVTSDSVYLYKDLFVAVEFFSPFWETIISLFSPSVGHTALRRACILIVKSEAGKAMQELTLDGAQQMMNSRSESYHVFQDDVRYCWKLPLTNVHGKGNYLQQWKMFLLCDPKKDQDPYHWEDDHPSIPY